MKFLRVKYLHDILYTAKHALPFLVATDFSNNNNNNEICAMWKQKAAQVIPTVISSTGVIPKSLSQSLTRPNLHPNTYIQMQKSVIIDTCSIVRNSLD